MTQNLLRFSFAAALALFLANGAVRAADTEQPQQEQAEPAGPACIDGMEEIPYTDDDAAIPVSDTSTGCQVSDDTIAT